MFCRLTCHASGVTGKELCFSCVLLMSLLIVMIMVVLFYPLNFLVVLFSKKYLMTFLVGHSEGKKQKMTIFFRQVLLQWLGPIDFIQSLVCYRMRPSNALLSAYHRVIKVFCLLED